MFFILSKTLNFFLQPFNWLLLLILWALLTRNPARRNRILIASLLVFLAFSNPFLSQKAMLAWEADEVHLKTEDQFEVGILLTGMCSFNLNTGQGYFKGASDRFIQTVRLYKLGHIKKILVTGGNSSIWKSRQQYKEADFLHEQLVQMGIPDEAILIDNQSRNTHENGVNSKKIIDSLQLKGPFLLITSATHIRRSLEVFNKAGLQTTPYPCHYRAVDNPFLFWSAITPSLEALEHWNTLLKESAGLLMYKLTGKA